MAGDPPQPRVCHIKKVANFDGYGFNLHAEKNKPGQFVGKIDPGSPAEHAGLKEGDRIVEVNGANVNQENHKQVVARIKSVESETRLLVVDKVCEEFHRQHGLVVKSSLSYVKLCSNVTDEPVDDSHQDIHDNEEDETIDTRLQVVTIEDVRDEEPASPPTTLDNDELKISRDNSFASNKYSTKLSSKEETSDDAVESSHETIVTVKDVDIEKQETIEVDVSPSTSVCNPKIKESLTPRSSRSSVSTSPSPSEADKFVGLDLPCTAAEMKMRINSKKKRDPRKDNRMDFNRKHQIIQSL